MNHFELEKLPKTISFEDLEKLLLPITIEYKEGHMKSVGKTANQIKNPAWKIRLPNNAERWIMFCEQNTYTILCDESLQKILDFEKNVCDHQKITWFCGYNGYISAHIPKQTTNLYMHQVIMECYGNGKGTMNVSVDHMDRNPLNNSISNLRIVNRLEQESNKIGMLPNTKRARNHNAIQLPEGITQDMMRKYVVYYKNWLDRENGKFREYFCVEKHPNLQKQWKSTSCADVSIFEKLKQANLVAENLEKGILPVPNIRELPKYISIIMMRNKEHLVFDKKQNNIRMNLKMILPDNYNLENQLEIMNEKIKQKYNIDSIL